MRHNIEYVNYIQWLNQKEKHNLEQELITLEVCEREPTIQGYINEHYEKSSHAKDSIVEQTQFSISIHAIVKRAEFLFEHWFLELLLILNQV